MGVKIKGSVTTGFSKELNSVDFDTSKFDDLIAAKGYDVTWEKAMYCPRVRGANPKDHDIACTVCDGSGFVFYESKDTRMHMQSLAIDEQYFAYGRYDSGKVQVTSLAHCELSFWDRITLCESVHRFTELIHRKPDSLQDRPKYDIVDLLSVTWADRDSNLVTYVVGVDVQVDDLTGELLWSATSRPDDGTYYSVAYHYHPSYSVVDMVHAVRDTQVGSGGEYVNLSRQAVAQLRFLVRDEGEDDGNHDKPINPFRLRG